MNRILFEEWADHYGLLPADPRLEHARGVLRVKVGDRLDIGVVNGPIGKGRVESVATDGVFLSAEWTGESELAPAVHLLVGMPRPQTARKILFEATSLGVHAIHFFASRKSDPAYARSALWHSGEWRMHLVRGAEQAFVDTHVPEVSFGLGLSALIGELPREARRLALDIYEGTEPLAEACPAPPVVLAIGPERGWAASDRDLLRAAGFRLVHLGPRILRVETAVLAALSVFNLA